MSNLSQVRSYINDADGIFYIDAHVLDHINDCHLYTWWDTSPQLTTATLTVTASQDIATLPSTIMIPKYMEYNSRRYCASSQSELEDYAYNWRSAPIGQPKHLIVWDAERVRLFPRPDATYELKLVGIGWPTEVSVGSPDISLDRHYQQIVEHKASASLLIFVRPDLAEIHDKEANEQLNDYKIGLRNSQPHRIWKLRPGSRFNVAQQGNINIGRQYR